MYKPTHMDLEHLIPKTESKNSPEKLFKLFFGKSETERKNKYACSFPCYVIY